MFVTEHLIHTMNLNLKISIIIRRILQVDEKMKGVFRIHNRTDETVQLRNLIVEGFLRILHYFLAHISYGEAIQKDWLTTLYLHMIS